MSPRRRVISVPCDGMPGELQPAKFSVLQSNESVRPRVPETSTPRIQLTTFCASVGLSLLRNPKLPVVVVVVTLLFPLPVVFVVTAPQNPLVLVVQVLPVFHAKSFCSTGFESTTPFLFLSIQVKM